MPDTAAPALPALPAACACLAPAAPCRAGLCAGPCHHPWAPDLAPLFAGDSHYWVLTKKMTVQLHKINPQIGKKRTVSVVINFYRQPQGCGQTLGSGDGQGGTGRHARTQRIAREQHRHATRCLQCMRAHTDVHMHTRTCTHTHAHVCTPADVHTDPAPTPGALWCGRADFPGSLWDAASRVLSKDPGEQPGSSRSLRHGATGLGNPHALGPAGLQ